ncbi:hypothetical protein [Propylenella binzhouense]|uniref:hypothetical protein n=1 Tax=Propylenella binzhouense TaxID=2555902 RepID=UPI00136DF914|nr:hypothetical protein [Propylenella binzhouense]
MNAARRCYIAAMPSIADTRMGPSLVAPLPARARTTLGFAAICDHARLPWRFFARLHAADGSLITPA